MSGDIEHDPYEESFEQFNETDVRESVQQSLEKGNDGNLMSSAEPDDTRASPDNVVSHSSDAPDLNNSGRQSSQSRGDASHNSMDEPGMPMSSTHGGTSAPTDSASVPSQPAGSTILQQVTGQGPGPGSHGPGSVASQGSRATNQQHEKAGYASGREDSPEFEQQQQQEHQPEWDQDPSSHAEPIPGYMQSTATMPKPPLQAYRNADHEAVTMAFTPGTLMGIRSLPNALQPDFRTRLYDAMVTTAVREREAGRLHTGGNQGDMEEDLEATNGSRLSLSHGMAAVQPPMPLASGQKGVARVHPHAGAFTTFEYMPSEYERPRLVAKFDRLKGKLAQVSPSDFVVKAPPAGPKGAPAFSEYDYAADPYASMTKMRQAQDLASRTAYLAGPFVTGGRASANAALRGRVDECLWQLCRQLSTDWPTAFLQVFEDWSGAVVVSFDRGRALTEGDLAAYMQNLVKTSATVAEFSLVKDGTQWGLVDAETQSVFYLMWPPWVRHRYTGPPPNSSPGGSHPQGPPTSYSGGGGEGADSGGAGGAEGISRTESSNTRQAVIATDVAKMGALSRSAAAAKPPVATKTGRAS